MSCWLCENVVWNMVMWNVVYPLLSRCSAGPLKVLAISVTLFMTLSTSIFAYSLMICLW